jgi:hypothetical protein
LVERLRLGSQGLGSVLGARELGGEWKGEGEALRKDLLPGNNVVPAVNADRHPAGGVLLLHDAFDPSAAEHLPADAAEQDLVAVREGLPQETSHERLPNPLVLLLISSPPWERRARRITPEEGGAGAAGELARGGG